jgi:hypothetical protein
MRGPSFSHLLLPPYRGSRALGGIIGKIPPYYPPIREREGGKKGILISINN